MQVIGFISEAVFLGRENVVGTKYEGIYVINRDVKDNIEFIFLLWHRLKIKMILHSDIYISLYQSIVNYLSSLFIIVIFFPLYFAGPR